MIEKKRCSKCRNRYSLLEFRRKSSSKDGLDSWCKHCHKKSDSIYYLNNREIILQSQSIYRDKNKNHYSEYGKEYFKKNKTKLSRYISEYYKSHKEVFKSNYKQYYQDHKEEIKERVRQYSKNNPKKIQVHTENKRARKFGLGDKITLEEWNNLLDFYGNKCLRCGAKDIKLTQDHVIPLTKGGRNLISNIQPLCVSCNSSKHTDIVDYR